MANPRFSVTVHDEGKFDRLATDHCYIFGFRFWPSFRTCPIWLADGSDMRPGDCFTSFSGSKRSAGYPTIELIDGHLKYVGQILIKDFDLLCFEYWRNQSQICPNEGRYRCAYYGFIQLERGLWLFSTPLQSGRIVQTEDVGRVTSVPHDAAIRA